MFTNAVDALRFAKEHQVPEEPLVCAEHADLLLRAREGDARAFERLMIRFQSQVLRTCSRILRRKEDARDASQEVFLKLFRNLARIRPDSLRSWLYRVTVNVCYDMSTRSRRLPHAGLEEVPAAKEWDPGRMAQAEKNLELEQRRRVLLAALQSLPFKERAALVLRDIEELTTEETARILGSSAVTVRSQISSARVKIRRFCENAERRTK